MSEIVETLLTKYKDVLAKDDTVSGEIIAALEVELTKEQPNANVIAEIIRKPVRRES